MRILINAASAHMGGAVTYLQNVLRWLPQIAPQDGVVVYLPEATRRLMQDQLGDTPIEFHPYPHADSGGPARLYFDQVTIPRLLLKHRSDVLFSSTGFGTFLSPRPEVLLVRNPVYFSPEFHAKYEQLGRSLRRNSIRRAHSLASIRRADTVLFPTQAMQNMVERYGRIDPAKTEAIHYGFDHAAFAERSSAPYLRQEDLARWRAEGYRLILNVSTYAVHKNYEVLTEAMARLRAQGEKVKLLLTTSREKTGDKEEYDAWTARYHELGVEEDVVELGYVPYNQLGALYEAADVYAFPSFTESFGHSLPEAMASGLPIVASDMAVNRELCGDAGAYFDTFDAEDAARVLGAVLNDEARRATMRQASLKRALHFSWEGYVRQLLGVFRALVPGVHRDAVLARGK